MCIRDSMFDMEMFGRRITRPMYVLAGLQAHKAILGIDFVKEQQLVIDGDEVRWRGELAAICPDSNYLLYPTVEYKLDPRTVRRVNLRVMNLAGQSALPANWGCPIVTGPPPASGMHFAPCKRTGPSTR